MDRNISLIEEVSIVILGLPFSQAHWKGYKQRKTFKDRKEYLEDHTSEAVKVNFSPGSSNLYS